MQTRLPLLVLAVSAACGPLASRGEAGERVARVIDGDTFVLESGERIRVARIDSPETQRHQAGCAEEVRLGRAAAETARELIQGRLVEIERTGRSYERTVAQVQIDGRDFGQIMIERGAARAWPRGGQRPAWCALP